MIIRATSSARSPPGENTKRRLENDSGGAAGGAGLANNGKSQRGLRTRCWLRLHRPAASTPARGRVGLPAARGSGDAEKQFLFLAF